MAAATGFTPAGLPRRVAFAYAIGALSSGLVGQALTALALLFYNQVVGLSPAAVGLALMISLICDAVFDPALGVWSDSVRTRLGRRHPFMYAAIVPAGLAFWLLWSPPASLSPGGAFAYLVATLISTRLAVSLYEVPSTSLIPEMAPDYDARTGLISLRYFCGVLGALAASLLAFQVFLSDRAGGVTHRAGFGGFGLAGGVLISLTLLVSTVGTHRMIPRLRAAAGGAAHGEGLAAFAAHLLDALRNRDFATLVTAAVISSMAAGITSGLGTYFNLYFWGFSSNDLAALAVPVTLAGVVGVVLAPFIARRWGKKPVALVVLTASVLASALPMGLRLLGLLPGNSWPWLLPLIMIESMIAALLGVMGLIVVTSMLSDVVEDNAARTGRRAEGLFFAASGVLQKAVAGVGTFVSGLLLTLVAFPTHAAPGAVPPTLMHRLGLVYLPVTTLLTLAALAVLSRFRIDRARHAANLAVLAKGEG